MITKHQRGLRKMYLRMPERPLIGTRSLAAPPVKPYQPPFTKGGQYIREEDAAKLLTILAGPSPYQAYIRKVMTSQATAALPRKFLRIVSSPSEVPDTRLRRRFTTVESKIVGGTIDRRAGMIYMILAPGRRSDTRLELVLHEAVHLFAHQFMALVDADTFERTTEEDVSTRRTLAASRESFALVLAKVRLK
jgi:hypothetical protein